MMPCLGGYHTHPAKASVRCFIDGGGIQVESVKSDNCDDR